jgi:hypothetical protein
MILTASIVESIILALTGLGLAVILIGHRIIDALPIYSTHIIAGGFILSVFILSLVTNHALWRSSQQGVKNNMRRNIAKTSVTVGIIIAAWTGGGFLLYLTTLAIEPVSIDLLPEIIGIWALAGSISLIVSLGISTLGLRELSLIALLGLRVSPEAALLTALAFRVVVTLGDLVWSLVLIQIARKKIPISSDPIS